MKVLYAIQLLGYHGNFASLTFPVVFDDLVIIS